MKKLYSQTLAIAKDKCLKRRWVRQAQVSVSIILLTALLSFKLLAQAPVISYSSPHTYTAGKSITPLVPASTGVAAPGYNNPVSLGSGFKDPIALALDPVGNIYVLDFDLTTDSSTIKKIPVGGGAPIIVGAASSDATFIAADAAGDVYVASSDFVGSLQKIPAGGGTPVTLGKYLEEITGLYVDAAGNVYLATPLSSQVQMIPAGGGAPVTYATGIAQSLGIALDAAGNLYFAAFQLHRQPGSVQEELVGNSFPFSIGSGFLGPSAVAVDGSGNVFIADRGNNAIKEIPVGTNNVITLATGLNNLWDIAIDAAGNLYATANNKVEKFIPSGGYYINPGLPAGLSFDNTKGTITGTPTVVSPSTNYTITAYNTVGSGSAIVNIATTFPPLPVVKYNTPNTFAQGVTIPPLSPTASGVATPGYSKNITSLGSGFNTPQGVATDTAGNVYVADSFNNSIKKIPAGGGTPIILTATNGFVQYVAADATGNVYFVDQTFTGPTEVVEVNKIAAGSSTPLKLYSSGSVFITGIAVDATGNIFISDSSTGTIKKIPLGSGAAFNVASGFNSPGGIAIDAEGNIYVADQDNDAIKKIPAGGGSTVSIGSDFQSPSSVAVDAAGNVFVGDFINSAIKMIPADGGATIIINSTIVEPTGLAVGATGNLYIANGEETIKKITPVGGYYISPFLPKGLGFNNIIGIISGTPTTGSPATDYTVTGYNIGGSRKVKVNITVNPVLPTVPAQKVVFSDITTSSATASWINGNGAARAVFIAQKANGSALPVENVTYPANTAFGSGSEIGTTGWYCIYNGTGSTVNVTGLAAGTTYRVTVVEYYGNEGGEAYLNTRLSPASVTTVKIYPTVPALQVKFTNTTSKTTTANWINGDGARRAVFMHIGIYGSALPLDNTTYTANTQFGLGTQIGTSGWYCIYNGTGSTVNITGLTTYSSYRVTVVEYNGAPGNQKYAITRLSPGNVYTNALPSLNSIYLPGSGDQTTSVFSLNSQTVEANNILSPNGDGINDFWVIKNIALYPDNTVTVYDKAGNVVFNKKNYTNDWDGGYRGSVLNSGTYYYVVDLGNGTNIKGYITVVNWE